MESLAKISGKTENYSFSTQQQLDLLLDSDGESQLNSKYWSKHFGGVSETRDKTRSNHVTRNALAAQNYEPNDKATADSRSVL